jgi:hypothetical protein
VPPLLLSLCFGQKGILSPWPSTKTFFVTGATTLDSIRTYVLTIQLPPEAYHQIDGSSSDILMDLVSHISLLGLKYNSFSHPLGLLESEAQDEPCKESDNYRETNENRL